MPTRLEHDSLGDMAVPSERLWGAQTQRSLEHFRISTERMPPELIRALKSDPASAGTICAVITGTYSDQVINDSLGHDAGDVLAHVAIDRLQGLVDELRRGDLERDRPRHRVVPEQPAVAGERVAAHELTDQPTQASTLAAAHAGLERVATSDAALAVELLVGEEEQREVGAAGKEMAIARRLTRSLELLAAFGEQVGLRLPECGGGVWGRLGHRAGRRSDAGPGPGPSIVRDASGGQPAPAPTAGPALGFTRSRRACSLLRPRLDGGC